MINRIVIHLGNKSYRFCFQFCLKLFFPLITATINKIYGWWSWFWSTIFSLVQWKLKKFGFRLDFLFFWGGEWRKVILINIKHKNINVMWILVWQSSNNHNNYCQQPKKIVVVFLEENLVYKIFFLVRIKRKLPLNAMADSHLGEIPVSHTIITIVYNEHYIQIQKKVFITFQVLNEKNQKKITKQKLYS